MASSSIHVRDTTCTTSVNAGQTTIETNTSIVSASNPRKRPRDDEDDYRETALWGLRCLQNFSVRFGWGSGQPAPLPEVTTANNSPYPSLRDSISSATTTTSSADSVISPTLSTTTISSGYGRRFSLVEDENGRKVSFTEDDFLATCMSMFDKVSSSKEQYKIQRDELQAQVSSFQSQVKDLEFQVAEHKRKAELREKSNDRLNSKCRQLEKTVRVVKESIDMQDRAGKAVDEALVDVHEMPDGEGDQGINAD